jgi:N-acetyl-gamma-glutamyl-phosphate reductase
MTESGALRVAVAGCTGYIGMECVALLRQHPEVQIARLMGRSHAGERYCDVVAGSDVELRIEGSLEPDSADVVMAALPHTVAATHAGAWLSAGAVVIDLSADFRLRDGRAYERWYGVQHPAPELCGEAVYGMPELHRDALLAADLVAVPGCYPTAALLATVPALQAGLVEPDIVVDAKSGVSGAGRSPQLGTSFAEVNESVHAYGIGGHRHKSEMLEQLHNVAGEDVRLTFVPHLIPMTRGILVTAYLRPRGGVTLDDMQKVFAAFSAANEFVHLDAQSPTTKSVLGSNTAALHVGWQDDAAIVTVAIDNLVKGGAGQAVQDMNLRFGFDEAAGLGRRALWP